MVKGTIVTAPDSDSGTVMFLSEDTPSEAYEVLTDAVYQAKNHEDWVQVDTEDIPAHTNIGVAEYDEDAETVTSLRIRTAVLEGYGHRA